jgi:hypothetical protein
MIPAIVSPRRVPIVVQMMKSVLHRWEFEAPISGGIPELFGDDALHESKGTTWPDTSVGVNWRPDGVEEPDVGGMDIDDDNTLEPEMVDDADDTFRRGKFTPGALTALDVGKAVASLTRIAYLGDTNALRWTVLMGSM